MKVFVILFFALGFSNNGYAAGYGQSSPRLSQSPDTKFCQSVCSACQDMTNRQVCLQQCRGVVDVKACQKSVPQIKSPTDANNFGAEQFAIIKQELLEAHPNTQKVIENSTSTFRTATLSFPVDARMIEDTKKYLQNMSARAAKLVMDLEYASKKKGVEKETVAQIKTLFERAARATADLSKQNFKDLAALRKYANDILLNFKNLYGQGSTLKYIIDQSKESGTQMARMSGVSKAMLCNIQCRTGSCGKNEELLTKCMLNCDPKKISGCTKAAQKTGLYDKILAKLNIQPVASGLQSPPSPMIQPQMTPHRQPPVMQGQLTDPHNQGFSQKQQSVEGALSSMHPNMPMLQHRGNMAQAYRQGGHDSHTVPEPYPSMTPERMDRMADRGGAIRLPNPGFVTPRQDQNSWQSARPSPNVQNRYAPSVAELDGGMPMMNQPGAGQDPIGHQSADPYNDFGVDGFMFDEIPSR